VDRHGDFGAAENLAMQAHARPILVRPGQLASYTSLVKKGTLTGVSRSAHLVTDLFVGAFLGACHLFSRTADFA
jgi:hypothetical protein